MSHNILSLIQDRFDVRLALGECMININGKTVDCTVTREKTHSSQPTYTVVSKETGRELCTFRPYHLHGGPFLYQIEGVSTCGGDGSLILGHAWMLKGSDDHEFDTDDDEVDEHANV